MCNLHTVYRLVHIVLYYKKMIRLHEVYLKGHEDLIAVYLFALISGAAALSIFHATIAYCYDQSFLLIFPLCVRNIARRG